MKRIILLLIMISPLITKAQLDFKPGWYIVEKGAEYGIFANGYLDYTDKGKAESLQSLVIVPGECVYLWEQNNGQYIATEWFGRISFFKGLDKLTPVPAAGKIAYLDKDINDLNGKVLTAGSAVWVTDFNTATKTIKVMLNDKRIFEIPAGDVTMLASYITKVGERFIQFKKAQ